MTRPGTCRGPHPPLRVEREADPRVGQRPRPALGHGQEVGTPGLEVEHDQGTVAVRRLDVRPDAVGGDVVAEVPAGAGDRVGHGDDQLVHRLDPLALEQERVGRPPQPAVHLVGGGLAEHSEGPGACRAVVRHQEPVLPEDARASAGELRHAAYGGTDHACDGYLGLGGDLDERVG